MNKDFDSWNELKKKIDSIRNWPDKYPKEGEVWMSDLGLNIGSEQNGGGDNFSRPVVVVSKFNNQIFWCVPLSTKQKNLTFYFNYCDPQGVKVSAILAQMRLLSVKRLRRKMYDMTQLQLEEIKEKLKSFI